jgi:F-type H+-transporting ATPase subunit b
MLDIYTQWFLVLVANFLFLIFILNIILYKPLLKIFSEREQTVKGSLQAAKEMDRRKEEGIESMTKEIAAARHKAKEVFESLRAEGANAQKSFMADAEAKASEILQKGREELRTEVARARQALKADVEKFSEEIVRKLVKA